jgi:hypothetical protein
MQTGVPVSAAARSRRSICAIAFLAITGSVWNIANLNHDADADADAVSGKASERPSRRRRGGLNTSLPKIGMQRSDYLGAFTHGGRYAFDGTGSHVANGEDACEACLHRMVPFSAIASGAYKAFLI